MNGIVGFSLFAALSLGGRERVLTAQREALAPHSSLAHKALSIGSTELQVWGRGNLAARLHHAPDGSVLALVGSPHGKVAWTDIPESVRAGHDQHFEIPWDGRVVLLKISADGRRWTLWNDWVGSLPVFHAPIDGCRVVSTLEHVPAAAVQATSGDIFLPNLLSLLINGHTVGNRTLLKTVDIVPADSVTTWEGGGCDTRPLWTVVPSDERAESPWDDVIDEMHARSRAAIADTVRTAPRWVLPLSSGLDSRLIASVVAGLGAEVHAYAWGSRDTVDFVYSARIARTLGLPWDGIELGSDYLVRYTRQWARLFGSLMHFHGMYQMAFLDAIGGGPPGPILTGFLGDVISANALLTHAASRHQLYDEWLTHWDPSEIGSLLKFPVGEPLEEMVSLIESQHQVPGTMFKKQTIAEIRSRQRLYTSFQSTLSDYWRGVGTPFLNREYARFCLSLPRPAIEGRRALADVYRRHYPRVAAIPGTYAEEPFIRTGRYLLMRRLARALPTGLLVGPLRGFRDVQPRMDMAAVQAHGWDALWPLQEARSLLAEWMDVSKLDAAFTAVMTDSSDIRPLRKLQSVQAFAYRLLHS